MGALLAFEVTRRLGSRLPRHLFASGCRAPHIPRDEEPLHSLPDTAFVEAVATKYQGIPKGVLENAELLELVLPALRGDMTMMESYQHVEGPPLPAGISVLGGDADAHVAEAQLLAWRRHTSGEFSCTLFPGDHFFLSERRDAVLTAIRPRLRA
jgi:medium-chain acyl-[acyl-carrier-protein] hydrolase